MAPTKSNARRLVDLEERLAKDYDPEADVPEQKSEDSESEDGEDELAGTEHYVAVGKSKLRQKEPISLGAQYRGARVSRAALEDSEEDSGDDDEEDDEESAEDDDNEYGHRPDRESEELASGSEDYDDPDDVDLEADQNGDDGEIDSDEAFGDSDREKFKNFVFRGSSKPNLKNARASRRPVAADFLSSSGDDSDLNGEILLDSAGEEDDSELDDSEEEERADVGQGGAHLHQSGTDASDSQDEEDIDEDGSDDDEELSRPKLNRDGHRAELRETMNLGQKSAVATMSQTVKSDAEKGLAVRQQRRAYDSLLNIRIRLQKALVAVNSFGGAAEPAEAGDTPFEAAEAAEAAAIKLLSTLDSFRGMFLAESDSKTGEKRKRVFEDENTSEYMWDSMQHLEKRATAQRRKTLDKWSSRVRATTAPAATRKLGGAASQSLTSVIDDQLMSTEKLVKRTQMPRSCAPIQSANKVSEDPEIYDDADFYQLLLKELVDQRTSDGAAPGSSVATVKWAALKEAKTRKQVDRKASKGRKLRFAVHEKLQNFVAPEDRRRWEQEAIDRFFGTLFGQKMQLEEEDASDEDAGGTVLADDGLRLF